MAFMVQDVSHSMFFLFGKIVSSIYIVLTLVSWLGNGLIVLVTIRSKKLHGACNILIAMQAFADIFIGMSQLFFFYYSWNEQLVTFRTCWKVNFVFFSAMDFSCWIIFFIALDRLVSTKHPKFYKSLNRVYYIGGVLTFSIAYCAAMKMIAYLTLTDEETLCHIGQAVTGLAEFIWLGSLSLINWGVVFVYYALTKVLKNASIIEYQRINRSLNTMILVNLCGWVAASAGCGIAFMLSPNNRVFLCFMMFFGILADMNIAAPFFIYYTRSTLYRHEFRKFLGIRNANSVGSSGAVGSSSAPS